MKCDASIAAHDASPSAPHQRCRMEKRLRVLSTIRYPLLLKMLTTESHAGSVPIHLVYEEAFETWRAGQSEIVRSWLAANAFKGERSKIVLIPSEQGKPAAVVVGLGRRGIHGGLSSGRFIAWCLALYTGSSRALQCAGRFSPLPCVCMLTAKDGRRGQQ